MRETMALWMGLWVGAFGTSAYADSQKVVDIQTVRSRIAEEHAGWVAKESWVTRLSEQEIKRMLGLQKPPQGSIDFEAVTHYGAKAQKPSLDWRNVNGMNWLGPVMNQGNCGSCVAFSVVATLESRVSVANGAPWLRPSFSPQMLFACGGGGCESGWYPDAAADFLQRTGVPDEACMPYTSGSTGEDASCSQKCSDSDARSFRIAGSSMPTSYGGSVEAVKAALAKGPLVTTLSVYTDFLTYGGGVYKHVSGSMAGGHAVSMVGYDDAKRAWLIRNSWGAEWGENGFAWISWDDQSGVGADTWAFDISPSGQTLSVVAPSDKEYVSGQYELSVKSKGLRARGRSAELHFHISDGREVSNVGCRTVSQDGCTAQIDTTQLHEGRYEIYAQSGSAKSQVREFYVVNSEPKMTLTLAPADGTDLKAPLSGRPEFLISAQSAPVPIQHLEFRAIDRNGKIASIKSNDYVLEQMKMGWRTVTVPSGSYKLVVHGEMKVKGKTYAVDSNAFNVNVKN